MISYVAKVMNFCATSLQNTILVASLIGELIISSVLWFSSMITQTCYKVMEFFHIVYEDNVTIFTELPDSVKIVLDSVTEQFFCIQFVIAALISNVYQKVNDVILSIMYVVNAFYIVVSEVFFLIANTVIFLGETVWSVITFIPIHVPLLLKSLIKSIYLVMCDIIVSGYMRLLCFTNFLTEVPLESFMGIMSAVLILRLCVHYKDVIVRNIIVFYWSLLRNILYVYHMLYNYCINSEVHEITRLASTGLISANDNIDDNPLEPEEVNDPVESLCVICQERQKTVLTLPCRHICLCAECCRRLYDYQRKCPICRTFIYHSVTVYW